MTFNIGEKIILFTLFAKRTTGIEKPSIVDNLSSISAFHFVTAWNDFSRVTSYMINAPTASL